MFNNYKNLSFLIPILSFCSKSYMVQILLIVKTFFRLACLLAPFIVIIVSIIGTFKIISSGKEDDLKAYLTLSVRRLIAGLVIFFIPTIISYVFTSLVDGSGVDFIACFETASSERVASLKAKEEAEEEAEYKREQEEAEREQRAAYQADAKKREAQQKIFEEARERYRNSQDSVSIANGEMFTPDTQRIITMHANDFNYLNFKSVINRYGGFQGYVNELGGVFEKYYGKDIPPVECASDLQEISEYVFGFMYLYGFDYYNGSKYCKWGGNCSSPDTKAGDAFYPSGTQHTQDGLSDPKSNFDKLISGANEVNMTTNCNWTVDMVYYKAGLFGGKGQPSSSSSFKSMGKKYQIIANAEELRVGDIVHFFRQGINKNDPSTWSNWYHVAFIGEVNKTQGYVVGYDGGSYYMMGRNFKWKSNIASGELHGTKNWVAVRIADIKQTC